MMHFLTISNLNSSKGTWILLKACRLLKEQGTTDFRVHFVGAGTAEISEEDFRGAIETQGLSDVAQYHGRLYGEEKERLLLQADVFVHPTLNDCFPLVLLEAMQHDLPIIATPVGAIPDMVEDGVSGLIIPEQDAKALAEAMQGFIEHPERISSMGEAARNKFQSLYTIDLFDGRLLAILRLSQDQSSYIPHI